MEAKTNARAITVTFGDVAENHARMQKIGALAERGFTHLELRVAAERFGAAGCATSLVDLCEGLPPELRTDAEPAYVLVVQDGVRAVLDAGPDALFDELAGLEWDTKALMWGRVVSKRARHNLCFAETAQAPDYAEGKGTVVAYRDVPLLDAVRARLPHFIGDGARGLNAEGNLYYDVSQCGIGFHGDAERRKVVALRLGTAFPLHYQWFQNSKAVGTRIELEPVHGDLYIMSAKAVGFDWKKRKTLTLRHAAGAPKFLYQPSKRGA